jgi:hypothetical protein
MKKIIDQHEIEAPPMQHREITLKDGRYMIFYTFDRSVPYAVESGLEPGSEPSPGVSDTETKNKNV